MANVRSCAHKLLEFHDVELQELRRQSRASRPPMAWVEKAHRCSLCNAVQATITWFGQAYRVPVEHTDSGGFTIKWPNRADASGASMGMGQ